MLRKVVCSGSQKAEKLEGPPDTWNCDWDKITP